MPTPTVKLRWRAFRADALGDCLAFARQRGCIGVMQSAASTGSAMLYASDAGTLRLGVAEIGLSRAIPDRIDPGRSWWLHGTDAIKAFDQCAAYEAALAKAIGTRRP